VLLDIGSILGGFALAVVAFVVVILVCVIILRLLAVILPPYQGPYAEAADPDKPDSEELTESVDRAADAEPPGDASSAGEATASGTGGEQEA
jgi:hypothetical protein